MTNEYIRVGTQYYKIIEKPNLFNGSTDTIMVPWSRQAIVDDHGKKFIYDIPTYNSFVSVPDHLNFQQEIHGCYNIYHKLSHQPKMGEISSTMTFLKHIFGDQLELGIEYMALLYLRPIEKLPVLCLVSQEMNTGKTTFLNWLKLIFQRNMTLNTNEEFKSKFNADWTGKAIIGVDETFLDRKEDSERMKNLSTSKTVKEEGKGKDKIEIPFFGKFILCSNNEKNFIYIDREEIRYWVRKINPLTHDDPFLLDKLNQEIPAFLHYLISRGITTERKSRMWFPPEEIETDALLVLKQNNESIAEKELKEIISDYLLTFNLDKAHFVIDELIERLVKARVKNVNRHYISSILRDKWRLKPKANASTYKSYYFVAESTEILSMTKQGRYYTFLREDFVETDTSGAISK
ncbi:primase-helicase family protein [Catalinimonas sp. 4WD22]|uniref:primase-helicase family protein n=1 Tax=Catalinimonas locisalis TaxID=3133978 RepID=UPI003101AB8D